MPQPVTIILAPFHAGIRDERVGLGPRHLMERGLPGRIRANGREVAVVEVEPVDDFEGEIGRTFEIKRRVSCLVTETVAKGRFPLVLSGNCNVSVGVHAGLGNPGLGVVWFDAHTDFDTPDERAGGYFDGMGVGTLTGRCWHALAASIPGHRPLDPERLVYCGIRDFEAGQRERVVAHGVRAVYGASDGGGAPPDFAAELAAALADSPREVLVHLDVDCLDTHVGRANEYACAGGLSAAQLRDCAGVVATRCSPVAMTVASFNPLMEGREAVAEAALDAIAAILGKV